MLEFNVGEIATRLRGALGVRGRIPLGLDEHVVPTVEVGNVSGPPFRRQGVRASGGNRFSFGTLNSFAGVILQYDPVRTTNAYFVVDRIDVEAQDYINATAAPTPALNFTAVSLIAGNSTPSVITPTRPLYQTEIYPPPLNSEIPYRMPLSMAEFPILSATAILASALIFGGNNGIHIDTEIVLQPNQNLVFWSLFPSTATEVSSVVASVSGLYYPA